MKQPEMIPVYMITGFLEAGKTKMILDMLKDPTFTSGEKTLIICCEEGEEEYDPDFLNENNAVLVMLEEKEELTSLHLKELNNLYKPERVIIEYNTMWTIAHLAKCRMPLGWEWVQIIDLADATTFDSYMINMRMQMTDPMKEADLILINRCSPDFNKSYWRKQLRALNPSATILFENPDGSTEDGVTDEDLPYDMKADIINIAEDQFGLFYLDSMDHPERYDGKKVHLVGQPLPHSDFPDGYYFFARNAMTCCANDIQPCGWVCQGVSRPNSKIYLDMTAVGHLVTQGGQSMLMLQEVKSNVCEPPKEKLVTFQSV
ncbi:MAG: GTPase [Clostridia bacterium]|nr:GTPase [Clostridia bacterium]